jgi:hypothetical protein
MISDLNRYVDFLVKHEITTEQFFLCYCIYVDGRQSNGLFPDKGRAKANIYKYAEGVKPFPFKDIDDLVDKGLLIDENKKGIHRNTYPDHFRVTDLFIDSIFTTEDRFEEFWSVYPGLVNNFRDIRGPKIPLKACDKDEVRDLYLKRVPTIDLHERCVRATAACKRAGIINMNILKWIGGEVWMSYEELVSDVSGEAPPIKSTLV